MKNRFILLLLLISYILPARAQEAKYIVKNYDLQAELSMNGSAWSMVSDTLGVVYFGVEGGIVSYNGTEWSLYPFGDAVIRSLFVDSRGDMWYGSVNDFGRVKRSSAYGLVPESYVSQNSNWPASIGEIWSIDQLEEKIIFHSREYLFVYSKGNYEILDVDNSYHRGFSLGGRYYFNINGKGLHSYSSAGLLKEKGGEYYKDMVLSGACKFSGDTLMLGTRENGVFLFDPYSGESICWSDLNDATGKFLEENRIYHLTALPGGDIAFATLMNGTLITDKRANFKKLLHYKSGVQDNAHYFLATTYDNNLCMCTGNGISIYNINSPFSNWDYDSGLEGVIMSIGSYNEGILAGTMTGLYYLPEPQNINCRIEKLLRSEVWDILELESEQLTETKIISSGDGLYSLGRNGLIQIFKSDFIHESSQLNSDSSIILSFGANAIHISRITSAGIKYLGPIDGLFSEFRTAAQEGNDFLWIGTRSAKTIRINQALLLRAIATDLKLDKDKTESFEMEITTDVHSVNKQVLFSNHNGFHIYDSLQHSFKKCSNIGSDVSDYKGMVSAMIVDQKGNIWIGGNEILLNRQDGTYTLHELAFDPVQDIFSAYVFYHDKLGKTWLGGTRGLYLYNNTPIGETVALLPVIIDKIVKDDSLYYLSASSCANNIPAPAFANGKNISIYYSLPDYKGGINIEYSWFLEGFSDNWSKWNKQAFLSLSNIRPGKYLLKVKAKTPTGIESEVSCCGFEIIKPWYSTIYARLSYLLIISVILYLIHIVSVKRKVRQELRIENLIQQSVRQNVISVLSSEETQKEKAGVADVTRNDIFISKDTSEGDLIKGKELMDNILQVLEENISDADFSVEDLCSSMNMSQTMLYRKLKSYTGLTINAFIRKIRLRKGAQLLLQSDFSISEVAYKVGFNNPGYFTKCFHQEFGQSPKNFQGNSSQEL